MKSRKMIGFVLVGILAVLAVAYIAAAIYFGSHFCFGTSIDGISVGGRTADEVEDLIRAEIETYSLKLVGREGAEDEILGTDIQIAPVFTGEIQELLEEQNGFAWIGALLKKEDFELSKAVTYEEEALDEVISSLSIMQAGNQRKPVDATYAPYVSGEGYALVPADYGTTLDKAAVKRAASAAIPVLEDTVDLDGEGCYVEPDVPDDDARLLALIDKLNLYTDVTVTYDFGEDTEVLDGDTVSTWLSVDGWDVVVDEEAALEYVKTLAKKYNTAYQQKTLKTSYGTTVTITGGHYGWKIDNEGETEQLIADIEAGEPVEREPLYLQRANSHGENDYGDSYVEINLTAQHLFVYKNGNLVVESDFVSGNVSKGHASPTGAFSITYKTTDAVLRGEDYETPVKYWMPFAGDVGMHDADWRSSFGGNIYKTNGSHGCINLPPSVAKTIYDTVDQGYAVLVYSLGGTESEPVQQEEQPAAEPEPEPVVVYTSSDVMSAIGIIGPVTLESETAIIDARNKYNSLSDAEKALVANYETLVAAEAALAELKASVQQEQQQPAETQPEQPAETQPEQPAETQPEQPAETQPEQPVEQQEQQPAGT